jgi:hypothetical protein
MARNYGNSSSRGMRNLGPTANGIGKVAGKGFQVLARQNASVDSHAASNISLMEMMWSSNFLLAKIALSARRRKRLMNTGSEVSTFEVAYGWMVDHLLFLWDVLWGVVEPILTLIFMTLLRVVLIIVVNVIFFGAIYLLPTS